MGFLKSIGKAIGGIARTVSKVADGIGKVTSFLQKPLDSLMAPIKKLVGGALDKLPFGIGNFVKPFADKFLDNALSFVAGGPLGGLGFLAKAMPTISKIGDLAQTVGGIAKKVGDTFPPQGGVNLQNIFAHAQAQKLLQMQAA
ncbi:hypothetical protein [Vitiosangium sp. GDMCC 1.1324]|uniref:hypothetical protein n=1 Tax=Vitiosangium sp. (strain GDMCC 1.1324) TaxID=2138576 RepID=UPI000D394F76|nr:hypothetical protein [Vitiosangium sp. GDMCC 1.1324]PTL79617.1 hypothetical protein DAT35_32935 [Vitiosangium sp. GDMCC 1.1324]